MIADFLFPKTCFGCKTEGDYLCQDCQAVLEVLDSCFCLCPKPRRLPQPGKCSRCCKKPLNGLYFAVSFKNKLVKNLIHAFKYNPYVKELAKTLASLIVDLFKLSEKRPDIENAYLIPIPLEKSKMKRRGFNQAEEIAKELAKQWPLPVLNNVLIKTRATQSQTELSETEREENIKGAFFCLRPGLIKGKKVFLIDDVYTTGATLNEAARILKAAGAREVWGIAVARG